MITNPDGVIAQMLGANGCAADDLWSRQVSAVGNPHTYVHRSLLTQTGGFVASAGVECRAACHEADPLSRATLRHLAVLHHDLAHRLQHLTVHLHPPEIRPVRPSFPS